MNELISVIIPVYNLEKYIDLTIKSLLSQTYKHFEVILVDDGSTDKTPTICDKYANEYDFIKVIHKRNGGVSSARNHGISASKGEWIFFLDGDDLLYDYCLEHLITLAHKTNCEIVEGNYVRILNEKKIYSPLKNENDYIENSIECLKSTLLYNRVFIYPRLYKKFLIKNIRFPEGIKIGEDVLFVTKILLTHSISIAHSKFTVYKYIQRKESAMHNNNTLTHYDLLSEKMTELINKSVTYTKYAQLFCCINLYFKSIKNNQSISKQDYKKWIKPLKFSYILDSRLSLKFKILFGFYFFNRKIGNFILLLRTRFFPIN